MCAWYSQHDCQGPWNHDHRKSERNFYLCWIVSHR